MSSGFVTEAELEEKRRVRQEEWEKVRKDEDPEEAPLPPEQLVDRRSLYERLQEQKTKKQEDFEEAHKLKNLVKVLDDDEADYLDYVDKARFEEDRRKRLEEAKELSEFRNKVAELREKEIDVLIKQEIGLIKPEKKSPREDLSLPSIGTTKTSQTKLLAGLVKRKSVPGDTGTAEGAEKRPKLDSEGSKEDVSSKANTLGISNAGNNSSSEKTIPSVPYKGNLVCIGVLPGLSSYSSSDESNDSTSGSEKQSPVVLRDLCGRRIIETDPAEAETEKKK